MKAGIIISTLLLSALQASAQSVRFFAPASGTNVTAGKPFTATVGFPDTTSSLDVIALYFGAKNPQFGSAAVNDLGQTGLLKVFAPNFTLGNNGAQLNVTLTFPTTLINGLDKTYNLTVGEFFTLGADNTPLTNTDQVTVFVSSS